MVPLMSITHAIACIINIPLKRNTPGAIPTYTKDMRKRYKNKRHSCKLCKPHKTKGTIRWKTKEYAKLKEFESLKKYAYT